MDRRPNAKAGWRLPGLGIAVVGLDVKFYAMLSLDTQFRLVSLTPALSCIPSASEGRDRSALYRAFAAASILQARILQDATHHQLPLGEPYDARLPYVSKLRRWSKTDPESNDFLEFEIQKHYPDTQPSRRFLYRAETKETPGSPILVKFVPQYCPQLHDICAASGHAPALLAYERLPGGLYGVAMEDALDAVPINKHNRISEHFEGWKTDLWELVAKFHDQDFVHGDLRDANILSGDDGCVKLVDFDWGGKDGEVLYPTPSLNPELLEGRSSESLVITRADDLRILENTLAKTLAQIGSP
ncbi:hypothetical protein BDN72DRAFT_830767 [Pluteus cervinus]|uniref:Uncharacterized protein n=1 Tax=Pluteus cervinus TaxID=181527 RepID=A0ACD3BDH5_9AGAR|nr:hypothetical protein BDN72DRAFT_830767 [Pluteus cervinus]